MSWQNDGGPAFPFAATDPSNIPLQASGMSLRDYFAAKALSGILCMPKDFASATHEPSASYLFGKTGEASEGYARVAYALADAMLAEPSKS